jgi:hypothetical protein
MGWLYGALEVLRDEMTDLLLGVILGQASIGYIRLGLRG